LAAGTWEMRGGPDTKSLGRGAGDSQNAKRMTEKTMRGPESGFP